MATDLSYQLGDWADRLASASAILEVVTHVLSLPSDGPPVSRRQSGIFGWKDHLDFDAMNEYRDIAPSGTSIARLDYLAWGKSHNLFCYFTDEATGARYRLSVFSTARSGGR